MTAITHSKLWSYTCNFCAAIRKGLVAVWNGIIALGETAGRARAAAELQRQGYHEEAKAIMIELKKIRGEV
tara:strand:- start:1366 stop:1578 length:213 start_codon:yes stop_codon:yes gene_type:complete